MTVTLSIKKVPDRAGQSDSERKAAIHKRSLQGELIAVLEEAASPTRLTVDELWQKVTATRASSVAGTARR